MKKIQNITVLAIVLGTSALASAQINESAQTPRENVTDSYTSNTTDDDGDGGKWGLAGLLGFLGLLRTRRNRDDHRDHSQVRSTNNH